MSRKFRKIILINSKKIAESPKSFFFFLTVMKFY